MEYKAQLVIRSREREGVELIESIKKLATDSDRTFSDMALELLTLGVAYQNGSAPVATENPSSGAETKSTSTPEKKSKSRSSTTAKSPAKSAPITPKSIKKAAKQCAQQVEDEDMRAATQTLATFFGKAEAIQGGRIKTELENSLEKADYDLLMKNLRKTQEYRAYRQRVILQF